LVQAYGNFLFVKRFGCLYCYITKYDQNINDIDIHFNFSFVHISFCIYGFVPRS
jgi:protein-arginine kinase activator protein McsA